MSDLWLKCSVRPGMFSNEVVVVVGDLQGRTHRFFVPRDTVSEDRVKVRVTNGDDVYWATIPTAQPNTIVPVKKEDLVAA